ncbi:hypothetical protein Scep_009791 [Stephania cephalantha]|uniref:ubiquitinyl hydrolase 1 n=1 Tax=Stephania cephalantha TaxID=152367 RepID=A0AAP0PGH8_9MAGN
MLQPIELLLICIGAKSTIVESVVAFLANGFAFSLFGRLASDGRSDQWRNALYHEVRESKLCAVHCVNTVLRGRSSPSSILPLSLRSRSDGAPMMIRAPAISRGLAVPRTSRKCLHGR